MANLPGAREWARLLLIAAGHLLLAIWALRLVTPEESVSLMWLPDGYLLGCLVLLPLRLWVPLLILLTFLGTGFELILTDRPTGMVLSFQLANMLESVGGAWLFLEFAGGRKGFRTFTHLGYFLCLCVLVLPALSASIGAGAVISHIEGADFLGVYRTWHASAALGILIVAPLVIFGTRWWQGVGSGRRSELGTLGLVWLGMLIIVFASSALTAYVDQTAAFLVFLSLPLLCWAAVQHGLFGAVSAAAVLVITAVQLTAMGLGPAQQLTASQSVFALQIYLGAAIIASIFTALAVENLRRASKDLEETSSRFRTLFDHSPVALWEEDFSAVKAYLQELRQQGVTDIPRYLRQRPEEVLECARRVRIIGVNDRTLTMFRASDMDDLMAGLEQIFNEQALTIFCEEIIALDSGATEFRGEAPQTRLDGEQFHTITGVNVVPGHEADWARVVVSVDDISDHERAEQSLQESNAMLAQLINTLDAGVVVHRSNTEVVLSNPRAHEILGQLGRNIVGRKADDPCWSFCDDGGVALSLDQYPVNLILDTGQKLHNYLVGIRKPDQSSPTWVLVNGTPLWGADGGISRIIVSFVEITELRNAENRLRESAAVFSSTSEGVVITDLDGVIQDVNKAFVQITGYPREDVIGRRSSLLQSGRHDRSFYQAMWQSLHEVGHWRGEIWNRRRNGNIYPELLTISTVHDGRGEPSGFVGVFTDITSLKESEERLEHLAHHDPLTQLPNRLLFNARLQQSIKQADRRRHKLAVAFIDLDRFKQVNDSLGHPVGDDLLKQVADRLTGTIRAADTAARISGDEFVVLLEDIGSAEQAAVMAQKLIDNFRDPFVLGDHEVSVTASIGIGMYPGDGEDAATLERNADAAMYRAKEEGRNNYQFYTAELTAAAFEHVFLENALRGALAKEELHLVYQPQFDLSEGQVTGLEALLRWYHPDQGVISPTRFIPIAEQSGLIRDIGAWVLIRACRQARAWLDHGLSFGRMAVNVAGPQLMDEGFQQLVLDTLESEGLDPEFLALEVTENYLMRRAKSSISQLAGLRSAGVEVVVDDFGTGYSSLRFLTRLPVDKLKIDQSFVRDMPENPDATAIVEAVIAMAQSLNLVTVAEGVEREEQARFLLEIGCTEAQGYLYSRPLPTEEIGGILSRIP